MGESRVCQPLFEVGDFCIRKSDGQASRLKRHIVGSHCDCDRGRAQFFGLFYVGIRWDVQPLIL